MFGYRTLDHEVVITDAVGPGPGAQHGPEDYVPDYEYDRRSAIAWWEETDGSEYYLGDWHSHPDSSPYLSVRDREVLEMISREPEARLSHPLMVIVGLDPGTAFSVWCLNDKDGEPAEAEPCETVRFEEEG